MYGKIQMQSQGSLHLCYEHLSTDSVILLCPTVRSRLSDSWGGEKELCLWSRSLPASSNTCEVQDWHQLSGCYGIFTASWANRTDHGKRKHYDHVKYVL